MKNLFKNKFLLDEKTAYIGKNSLLKVVANSNDNSFKQALLTNDFHYFFFWTEKCVSTSRYEERLAKYLRQWNKKISTSQKMSLHQQE